MMRAELENPGMCHVALTLNCVVFNVDYRLGPEFKCPAG
jgi:acetyl esterase/lipase